MSNRRVRSPRRIRAKLSDTGARRQAERQIATQREELSATLDSLPLLVVVIATDGRIRTTNRRWDDAGREALTPARLLELNQGNYLDVCRNASATEPDARRALTLIESVLDGSRPLGQMEYPCAKPDGLHWYSMMVTPLRQPERGAVIAHLDITDQRAAERRARLVGVVFDNASEGIVVLDHRGRVLSANDACQRMTGYAERDLLGKNWRKLDLHTGQAQETTPAQVVAQVRRDGNWHGELWGRKHDGREYPLWLNVNVARDDAGGIVNYILMMTDIARLKDAEHALYRMAYYDELTGLPNRALFQERVEHAIGLAQRSQRQLAVMFVDLDRFKLINDSLGHGIGDGLLRAVGERLRECVRRTDLVARLGGDEFIVLLEELRHEEDAAITARKIISSVAAPFVLNEVEIQIGASVGITLFPHDANNLGDLLKNADTAMYKAKEGGRNCFRFYTPAMYQVSQRRLWLENELRHALKRDEMRIVFQAQVPGAEAGCRAVEALLRWHHASGGLILPNEFIPVAEETGMIGQLGAWVLQRACQLFAAVSVPSSQPEILAVNVSPLQLRDAHFPEIVRAALAAANLPPERLELEVTESALFDTQGPSTEVLNQLSRYGVSIALDDFGTGYSSLTNLQQFPVRTVKIDRAFIRGIEHSSKDAGLVRAILAMASELGLETVAEGVESSEQRDLLAKWGCHYMQGYLFGNVIAAEHLPSVRSTKAVVH